AWQDIWLNEGFATYAEWIWFEEELDFSTQRRFDQIYDFFTPSPDFWDVVVADPGTASLLDAAIYNRGAMTLQVLRIAVGDHVFFDILRTWAAEHAGGNGTTGQFIELAERLSGQDLGALFNTWLFTKGRPDHPLRSRAISAGAIADDADVLPVPPELRIVPKK